MPGAGGRFQPGQSGNPSGRFQPGQSGNPSGRFQPGQSGNPSGRPKRDRVIEELARQHTDTAIAALVEICGNRDAAPAARVAAAGILLDRGWGKTRQPIEHSGEMTHKYVIRCPTPVESVSEWLARHAPKAAEPA